MIPRTPSPRPARSASVEPGRHTRLACLRLYGFVHEHRLGEVFASPLDVLFAEGDFVQPDLLFVASERSHLISDRGVAGPPDLVIEVLSPSTAERDRGPKLDRYRLYGVPEVWLVDPDERTIDVWRLARGATAADRYVRADVLEWTPEPGGPTLRVDVGDIVPPR